MRGTDAMERAFQVVRAIKQAKREGCDLGAARQKFPLLAEYEGLDQAWRLVDDPMKTRKGR